VGVAVFSFKKSGIVVSEGGVQATSTGSSFRMYAVTNSMIHTGIAVQNHQGIPAHVKFELTRLDGTALGVTGFLDIPASGRRSLFLEQIPGFESLPVPFEGLVRISSPAITVLGLRCRTNERGDFLITTTPASDESRSGNQQIVFPHIVNGDGYNTQIITFSGTPSEPADGERREFSQTGSSL
jgi:hypothetical protein